MKKKKQKTEKQKIKNSVIRLVLGADAVVSVAVAEVVGFVIDHSIRIVGMIHSSIDVLDFFAFV